MNKTIGIGITVFLTILILIPSVSATWCDANYGKKTPILINNTGGLAQTYFQVELNFTHDSDMNANFSDIRVYNETDCSLTPLWNESAVSSSWNKIWFNATSISASSWTNSTYYLYYNHSGASSTSSITTTFPFGDDFEGVGLDTDKWTQFPTAPPYEWTQKAPLLGSETLIWGLVELNTKIYGSGPDNGDLLEWNGANAWVQKAPSQGALCPIVLYNGKIYGAGVHDTEAGAGQLFEWNGTDAWVSKASQVSDCGVHDLIVYNSKLYGICKYCGKLLEWNDVDAWVEKAPQLGSESYGKTLGILDNELYGGFATSGKLQWWNQTNSSWEVKATQYGSEAYIEEMITYNNKLYAGTGQTGLLLEWNEVDAWVAKTSQWGSNTHLIALIEWDGDLYGGISNAGELVKWNGVDGWTKQANKYGSETHLFSFINFSSDLYAGTYPGGKLLKLQGYTGGNIVVSSGTMTLTGDGATNGEPKLIGKIDVGVNHTAKFKAKLSVTNEKTFLGFTDQTTATNNAYVTGDNAHFYAANDGNVYYYSSDNSASEGNIGVSSYDTSYHIWEAIRNGSTSADYLYDDISQGSHTTQVPDANMHLDIYSYGASTASIECDWVLIRKYTSPEPTAQLGAEESPSIDTSFTVTLPVDYDYAHFQPPNSTAKNYSCNGQNSTTPFYNVTNTGNVNLDVRIKLNTTITNIILRADTDNNPSGSSIIQTTLVTIYSNLAQNNSIDIWLWSDFNHTIEQATNKSLSINVTQ